MEKRAALTTNILAMFLGVAILISIGTTVFTLDRLHTASLTEITGAVTGTANVTITNTTSISLPNSTVAFGDITIGTANDTTDNNPLPFQVRNDGSVNVNVTINASALFTGLTRNQSSYRFVCRADEGENCPTGSAASLTDMPTANDTLLNRTAVFDLPADDSNDSRFVDIEVRVPSDEPGGAKSSTVTFTAAQI